MTKFVLNTALDSRLHGNDASRFDASIHGSSEIRLRKNDALSLTSSIHGSSGFPFDGNDVIFLPPKS